MTTSLTDTSYLFRPSPGIGGSGVLGKAQLPEVGLRGIGIHAISEAETVEVILDRLDDGQGGWVVTPNVDHLRRTLRDPEFKALYEEADLRVADGMVLVWACQLQRTPVPERVSGSNLIVSLSRGAARRGRSICLVGGNEGTAEQAAEVLKKRFPGLIVAGVDCPPHGFEKDPLAMGRLARRLRAARPDIVFMGLGSPKQERVIRQLKEELPQAWWLGVGVSFSFVAGEILRAPKWMQRVGLEWFHRFCQEPKRLFRRYFVNGMPFAAALIGRSLVRGTIPKARVVSRYARPPRALIVDDDPFAMDHLELLIGNSFPEVEIEKRSSPDASGAFDFYFLDNDFGGQRRAGAMARQVRGSNPEAKIFAFSGALDVDSLKRLINSGCDGVCEKGQPDTWKPIFHDMRQTLARAEEQHVRETGAFGGVRTAARSIHGLLSDWNGRQELSSGAPVAVAEVAEGERS